MPNKSEDIKAGVVLVTKFVIASAKAFNDYIEYIDRTEAIENDKTQENLSKDVFKEYIDYMGNPEKSTALFTADKDKLTFDEKATLKQAYKIAQGNNSIMWQTVITFDNRWLEKNKAYDSESGILDERIILEATRASMNKMLENENLKDTSIWSAAIHYNTDNIHVHIATVEPIPTRERGKFKYSSIYKGKSKVVNTIIQHTENHDRINSFIRKDVVEQMRNNPLMKDKELCKKFLELHKALPKDRRKWNYNMNSLNEVKPLIDDISKTYLAKYKPEEYKDFKENIMKQSEIYSQAYGQKDVGSYSREKEKDLLARMGNTILKEVKAYDYDIIKNKHRRLTLKRSLSGVWRNVRNSFTSNNSYPAASLTRAVNSLKYALKSDFESERNQQIYERLQAEIENEK